MIALGASPHFYVRLQSNAPLYRSLVGLAEHEHLRDLMNKPSFIQVNDKFHSLESCKQVAP